MPVNQHTITSALSTWQPGSASAHQRQESSTGGLFSRMSDQTGRNKYQKEVEVGWTLYSLICSKYSSLQYTFGKHSKANQKLISTKDLTAKQEVWSAFAHHDCSWDSDLLL